MADNHFFCLPLEDVPRDAGWLYRQPYPVIAIGAGETGNADVVLPDESELDVLLANIRKTPVSAMTLVQVLRVVENLPIDQGMTVESLAYATLQGGSEHRDWLASREKPPQLIESEDGEPLVIRRESNIVYGELNRPEQRNSLSVAMRDALVELFELVIADDSVERVMLSGRGACFSVGGELSEFGLLPDLATGHFIRSTHNPGRLLARCADRVACHLHSACIGSGIELPAFASHISAAPKTFFQLPELNFGLIPGAGGCVSISRRVGRQRTAWLGLSGKKINAETALDWGLVDEIVAKAG